MVVIYFNQFLGTEYSVFIEEKILPPNTHFILLFLIWLAVFHCFFKTFIFFFLLH